MDQITEDLFKDILKRERALRGWSQADVAAKIGSDPKTVGRWERGLTFPSPYMSQQLCALYGKTVQELRLVKTEHAPPAQDKSGADHNEEGISAPAVPVPSSSAAIQVSSEAEDVQVATSTNSLSPRIVMKRVPLLFSILSVFILLIVLGEWLLPRLFTPVASHPVVPSISPDPYTGKGVLALDDPLKANTVASWSL